MDREKELLLEQIISEVHENEAEEKDKKVAEMVEEIHQSIENEDLNDIDSTIDSEEQPEDEDETEEEDNQEITTKSNNGTKVVSGILIGTIGTLVILGSAALFAKCSKDIKTNSKPLTVDNPKSNSEEIEASDNVVIVPIEDEVYEYNDTENVFTLVEENQDEPLTNEKFEELVNDAWLADLRDNNIVLPISIDDFAKFISIANIDKLAEDNPELIRDLAGTQAREEYLNDAAKVIGASVMYNFNAWNNTRSTEDFIKVSPSIYGKEQKNDILLIEDYTDRIALSVNEIDNEEDSEIKANKIAELNTLINEFIVSLNSGSLSKLDDGVGFAAQVNIAMIADGIARDYLNQQNFDMFQILKTSEKYVSNIFTEYERCHEIDDTKTYRK